MRPGRAKSDACSAFAGPRRLSAVLTEKKELPFLSRKVIKFPHPETEESDADGGPAIFLLAAWLFCS